MSSATNVRQKETESNPTTPKKGIKKPYKEVKNQIFFKTDKDDYVLVSNFTIENPYLISGKDPKRVIEVENQFSEKVKFTISSLDFASIQKFKGKIEGLGNFLWFGGVNHLNLVKSYLFSTATTAEEITFLGHNPEKDVYCFSNGIYNGKSFIVADEDGFCKSGSECSYYIPFMSKINDNDGNFDNYRKFVHIANDSISFEKWSGQVFKVYGDNGILSISYILSAIFRDVVFSHLHFFPHLFLFGPPHSGKSAQSDSIMCLFGVPQSPINLEAGSTQIGSFRKLEQVSNALVAFNEYKNNVEPKLIGLLKAAYDGQGREKGNYTNDSTTKTSHVRSGLVIAGQDLPSNDPALFSRVIPLTIVKQESYTDEERSSFSELASMEKSSITNVLLEILQHRDYYKQEFSKKHKAMLTMLKKELADKMVNERSLLNYAILLTSIDIFSNKLKLPFNFQYFKTLLINQLIEYTKILNASTDVNNFWKAFEYLAMNYKLTFEKHYTKKPHIDSDGKEFDMIYLRWGSVYPEYRKWMFDQRNVPLSNDTILQYLKNTPAYYKAEITRFGAENVHSHWFEFKKLNISLSINNNNSNLTT